MPPEAFQRSGLSPSRRTPCECCGSRAYPRPGIYHRLWMAHADRLSLDLGRCGSKAYRMQWRGNRSVLVLLFINAMGIMLMLVPSNTYILDRAGHVAGGAVSAGPTKDVRKSAHAMP